MSVKFHEAFSLDSARRRYLFEEHFLGDSLRDLWRTAGTVVVVDAQDGGIIRQTTGATTGNSSLIDWNDYRTLLATKQVTLEFRLKLTQTTDLTVSNGLLFDGVNWMLFYFNTDSAHTDWYISNRDAGGAPVVNTGVALDTNYHIFRIEAFPTGEVHYYIDGVETANSPITTNITANYLQPRLYIETREDVAKSMDIDYVVCRQER